MLKTIAAFCATIQKLQVTQFFIKTLDLQVSLCYNIYRTRETENPLKDRKDGKNYEQNLQNDRKRNRKQDGLGHRNI